MGRIKRCPFCGRKPHLYDFTIDFMYDIDNPIAWIDCECGVSTSTGRSRGFVRAMWNRRDNKPVIEMCQDCGMKPAVFNRAMNGKIETQLICPHCRTHTAWHEDSADAIDEWNQAGGER